MNDVNMNYIEGLRDGMNLRDRMSGQMPMWPRYELTAKDRATRIGSRGAVEFFGEERWRLLCAMCEQWKQRL